MAESKEERIARLKEELRELGVILGTVTEKKPTEAQKKAASDPLLAALDARFPEFAQQAKQKELTDKQLFDTLNKRYKVIADNEEQRQKIMQGLITNPDLAAQLGIDFQDLLPDPEVLQTLLGLQTQLNNIANGESPEDALTALNPELITIGEGEDALELTQEQVDILRSNPDTLQTVVTNLVESGKAATSAALSEFFSQQVQDEALTDVAQPSSVTQGPGAETAPTVNPLQIGQSTSVDENIKNNIASFTQRADVDTISRELKRARNQKFSFAGGLS